MTYLFFLRDLFLALQLNYKYVEILLMLWINIYTLLWTVQNLMCCFKCLITVWSAIGYNILPELFKLGHIRIHADDIDQQFSWLEVEPFRITNLKLQTFTGGQLIKTKVQCLGEFLTKLFRDEWFLTMGGNLSHQLDDHVTELEAWFGCSWFVVVILLSLVSLLLIKLVPLVSVFFH